MEKRAEKRLLELEEKLRFFSELGYSFFLSSEEESLLSLEEKIRLCRNCSLGLSRTNPVPGEGNKNANLMFVGEAPGQDEDSQGRPFVGKAGQLLTKIIRAMTFEREEVYITNVLKCRPPNNRTPLKDEVEKCAPFLIEQIRAVNPRVIVALGKVATDFFVPSALGMSALRGNFFECRGIEIMPTFHPSYLVRNEGNKKIRKMVWDDMQKVMARLGRK